MVFKAKFILVCLTLSAVNGEEFCEEYTKRKTEMARRIDFSFGNYLITNYQAIKGSTTIWRIGIDRHIWSINVTEIKPDLTVHLDRLNSIESKWFGSDIYELAFNSIQVGNVSDVYTIGLKKKYDNRIDWARLTANISDMESRNLQDLYVKKTDMKLDPGFTPEMASPIDLSYQIIVFIGQLMTKMRPNEYKREYRFYDFNTDTEVDQTFYDREPFKQTIHILGLLPSDLKLLAMLGPLGGGPNYLYLFGQNETIRYCYLDGINRIECSSEKSTLLVDCSEMAKTTTPDPNIEGEGTDGDTTTIEPEAKSMLWPLLLFAVLLIIVAIVGLLVWLFSRQSAPATDADIKATETVVTKEKVVVKEENLEYQPLDAVRSGTL